MFDIGFSELVLIALLALIVLGPQRLPEAARAAGRWMARLRRFVAEVKRDFDRELASEELAELRRLKEELDETRRLIGESSNEVLRGLHAQVATLSESVERAAAQSSAGGPPSAPPAEITPAPPVIEPPRARRDSPAAKRLGVNSAGRGARRGKSGKRKKTHGHQPGTGRKDRGR